MTKKTTTWPKNTPVRMALQNKIDAACQKLARLCIVADIDLTYVDRDGLSVKVDLARPKPRKRKMRH